MEDVYMVGLFDKDGRLMSVNVDRKELIRMCKEFVEMEEKGEVKGMDIKDMELLNVVVKEVD